MAFVLAALAAAGCAGPPPPRTEPDFEPGVFTLGYAVSSDRDRELVRSAQRAVEEVNAEGGVGGAVRLELLVDDEGGEAGEVARRLVLRGVQALLLTCDPEPQRKQADVADRTQVLAFAPCNEDPTIAERYPIVWPVSLGANAEAAALADYALAQRYESFRAVGVWEPMARYLREAAEARGIEVRDDAEVVLGTHRVESGKPTDGTAFTTFGFEPGRAGASLAELGHDAVAVLAAAMAAAGDPDPIEISERLSAGLTVQGAFGEIVYPGSGEHQPETAATVVRIEGGKRVLVEKSLPEDIPPP